VGIEPDRQLAQQVRDPRPGVAPADVDQPLAEYSTVQQRVEPRGARQRRPLLDEVEQRLARHHRHRAGAERLHAVVVDRQQAALQVDELTREVKRDDLPGAVADHLLAERAALEDQAARGGHLAVANDEPVAIDRAAA
jgi:hypothetical protein